MTDDDRAALIEFIKADDDGIDAMSEALEKHSLVKALQGPSRREVHPGKKSAAIKRNRRRAPIGTRSIQTNPDLV
jgi:hypothetical protein